MPAAQPAKQEKFRPGRIKPNPDIVRRDPRSRNGFEDPQYQVENPDPDAKYFWASLAGSGAGSRDYMESTGWQVVMASADPSDPHVRGRKIEPNTPIVRGELVLMHIHKDDHAYMLEHGDDRLSQGLQRSMEIDKMLAMGRAPGDDTTIDGYPGVVMQGHDSSELVREN